MRILHIINSLNPKGGGPSEAVKQLCAAFKSAGKATVAVATCDPPESPWLPEYSCEIHALGPGMGKYSYHPQLVSWLRQNAHSHDCVIVNGIWQYTSFAAWRALRKSGTPYFVFTHGMLDPWFKRRYPLKHLKKWLYWPWAEYRVLRDAKAVMFTCEEERVLARESFWLYTVNECVVNYGTARPHGDALQQREAFLGAYSELRGKRILLFLSRIHEKKGCDLLIQSFGELFSKSSTDKFQSSTDDLRLVIAGPCADPAYLESLRNLTNDNCPPNTVSFPGMLSGDLKWGAFHAADAFVLPSHQENFGIAVAEALACGLPVLISNRVNIWREIEHDGAGMVANDTLTGTREVLRGWLQLDNMQKAGMKVSAERCFERRFEINRAAESLYSALTLRIGTKGSVSHV